MEMLLVPRTRFGVDGDMRQASGSASEGLPFGGQRWSRKSHWRGLSRKGPLCFLKSSIRLLCVGDSPLVDPQAATLGGARGKKAEPGMQGYCSSFGHRGVAPALQLDISALMSPPSLAREATRLTQIWSLWVSGGGWGGNCRPPHAWARVVGAREDSDGESTCSSSSRSSRSTDQAARGFRGVLRASLFERSVVSHRRWLCTQSLRVSGRRGIPERRSKSARKLGLRARMCACCRRRKW